MLILPDTRQLESLIDDLCAALAETGYAILDDMLPNPLGFAMQNEALQLTDQCLVQAATGRNQGHQLNKQIRADGIYWFEPDTEARRAYFFVMEAIRKGINCRLYLGLFEYECHYSKYEPGAFYKTHLDAFTGRRNRVVSTVYYLNPDWTGAYQGELVLYAPDAKATLARISPTFNRMVVFMSERFPHEVLPTRKARYSVAGWYRINPQ